MATFNANTSTENSISASIVGMDTGFAETRNYRWYLNGTEVGTSSTPPYAGSAYYTYTGLAANTWYHLEVNVYGAAWNFLTSFSTDGATQENTSTLTPWSWSASNGSATVAQTQTAYALLTGDGYVDEFPYQVWNDLVNKVNEAITKSGGSWATNYDTLANTLMSSADKEITAIRFNSLKFNLGSRYSTGIADVSAGSVVFGSYFTSLATKLNEYIATL